MPILRDPAWQGISDIVAIISLVLYLGERDPLWHVGGLVACAICTCFFATRSAMRQIADKGYTVNRVRIVLLALSLVALTYLYFSLPAQSTILDSTTATTPAPAVEQSPLAPNSLDEVRAMSSNPPITVHKSKFGKSIDDSTTP
jgi:hypothetical protein